MVLPTDEQLHALDRFERYAFRVCDFANRNGFARRAGHLYLRGFGARWVHLCTRNLLHVYGLHHLPSIRPDRGVVLVSNHRSFFDLYVISSVLLRNAGWIRKMYFPVRSTYFYERADGVAVNALMSAFAMYPPVVRDPRKRSFNRFAIEMLTEVASRPGTVVGIHPEGTRSKSDDPYTLLPAQPGVGQLVHEARPVVVPAFILGLSNDFLGQIRGNFDGTGAPITLAFGEPVDLSAFWNEPRRLRTHKHLADHLRARLTALGERTRDLRAWEGFPTLEPKRAEQAASRAA